MSIIKKRVLPRLDFFFLRRIPPIMNIFIFSPKKTDYDPTVNLVICVYVIINRRTCGFFSLNNIPSRTLMHVENGAVLIPLPLPTADCVVLIDPLARRGGRCLSACFISDVPCSGQVKSFTCDAFY
jgi:hypothetical protein